MPLLLKRGGWRNIQAWDHKDSMPAVGLCYYFHNKTIAQIYAEMCYCESNVFLSLTFQWQNVQFVDFLVIKPIICTIQYVLLFNHKT